MTGFHLAQFNIAIPKQPLEAPDMSEFASELDRIDALAEASRGFVWRLPVSRPRTTAFATLSVWRDLESLERFVYDSSHVELLWRRGEWFEPTAEASMVLWWVAAGHLPSTEEALGRLARLRREGPTPGAFTFRFRYAAPGPSTPIAETS